MKILHVIQTLDPSVGGVAAALVALSRGLAQRGHEVAIVCLDEEGDPWLGQTGLVIHPLGKGLTSYRFSSKLQPWLEQNGGNYDCAVVHGIWQHLSLAVWRRYAGSSIPYFVFPHGMLDPWFKRTFPLKHLKKWLYWPWAEYRVLRDSAAVIFTSEEECLQARKSFWLYKCREKVSPLGIAREEKCIDSGAEFLSAHSSLRGTDILLFLGRLHPKKGCDLLIDALARIGESAKPVSLIIAGPDQVGWEKELRRRVAEMNLAERVVFAGMLQGAAKEEAFAAAAAFILPSHQENFGMAVIESLAAGVPVLISNCVNIWREIDQDRAGYIETDDLAGTMRLIERWIATSASDREMMRRNAQRCFDERFEINKAVDSLLQILTESPPKK